MELLEQYMGARSINAVDYQDLSKRTREDHGLNEIDQLVYLAMGAAEEGSEVCGVIKKTVFHGHELNKEKLIEEMGYRNTHTFDNQKYKCLEQARKTIQ